MVRSVEKSPAQKEGSRKPKPNSRRELERTKCICWLCWKRWKRNNLRQTAYYETKKEWADDKDSKEPYYLSFYERKVVCVCAFWFLCTPHRSEYDFILRNILLWPWIVLLFRFGFCFILYTRYFIQCVRRKKTVMRKTHAAGKETKKKKKTKKQNRKWNAHKPNGKIIIIISKLTSNELNTKRLLLIYTEKKAANNHIT